MPAPRHSGSQPGGNLCGGRTLRPGRHDGFGELSGGGPEPDLHGLQPAVMDYFKNVRVTATGDVDTLHFLWHQHSCSVPASVRHSVSAYLSPASMR